LSGKCPENIKPPRHAEIQAAVCAIDAGDLVVYPTETVYGLGANAASAEALERLLEAKGREAAKGLSVLVRDLDMAAAVLVAEVPRDARRLAAALWPGPLTIVLPAAQCASRLLVGASGGVGLRCSSDPVATCLVESAQTPITATSANPSGCKPATDVATARGYFGDAVAFYLDAGPREAPNVSTVVEFLGQRAYLRRRGAVGVERLSAIVSLEV